MSEARTPKPKKLSRGALRDLATFCETEHCHDAAALGVDPRSVSHA